MGKDDEAKVFLLPLCCLINNIAYDDRFRKEGDNMHKFMRTIGFSMYQKKQDMATPMPGAVSARSSQNVLPSRSDSCPMRSASFARRRSSFSMGVPPALIIPSFTLSHSCFNTKCPGVALV